MNKITALPISDELLAAYLDGHLNEKQSEYVEKAIEENPELQWIVDQWLDMQILSSATGNTTQSTGVAISHHNHNHRIWAAVASIIIVVAVALPLIIKTINLDPSSGMPSGFPVSNRYESEYPSVLPSPVSPSDESINENSQSLKYQAEKYKSAIIITWDQPLDTASCIATSNSGRQVFTTFLKSGNNGDNRIFVIPLNMFQSDDFPITVNLFFQNHEGSLSDSFPVNK